MESDYLEGTPPRTTPPQKSKLKSPVAKEVEKLRNNGLADKDIIDKLIESDGFTLNNKETNSKKWVNPNITPAPNSIINEACNFSTLPPVKRIAEPISSEKPQKFHKSNHRTNNENSNNESTEDLNKTSKKQVNRQIVILKNIEPLKKFCNQRENIPWLYFSKHLDFSLEDFKIDFEKEVATFRPTTIQDFNKFFKNWPDSSGIPISDFKIKDKGLRPTLCINKVKQEINVEDPKNRFIRNFQFEPENFKRLIRKNGRETTLVTFQLNSEEQVRQVKHGIKFEGLIYDIREYIDREKKIVKCFKYSKFGHFTNICKQQEKCPRCNNLKSRCKGSCNKEIWKCINCGGDHSAAWAGCPICKEKLKEVNTKIQIKIYSQVAASNIDNVNDKLIKESNYIKSNYIKINTLIDVLSWLVKNINNKKLNLPPEKIKEEIEYIVLKTCG